MSRLPQPGDAVKATRVLNARMEARLGITNPDVLAQAGEVTFTENGLSGPGASTLLAMYGDLFDITETLSDAGFGHMLENHEAEVEAGVEPLEAALVAVALQGIAHGVLQERVRWERGS